MTGAYGIQEIAPSTPGALICGTCGRAWAEDITPAGRCPWEDRHSLDNITVAERAALWDRHPLNWAEMGSSEKDLWEERQLRSLRREALRVRVPRLTAAEAVIEDVEMAGYITHPPRHHKLSEVCLRAITTMDCPLQHDYHGERADQDEIQQMRWARKMAHLAS